MANDIRVTLNVSHTKAPKLPYRPGTINITQTGSGVFCRTVDVGTSEEDVTFSDITTEHVCVLENLDATNFVQWGKKDGAGAMQAIGRLRPVGGGLHVAILGLEPGAVLRMKADTAGCKVQVYVYEA